MSLAWSACKELDDLPACTRFADASLRLLTLDLACPGMLTTLRRNLSETGLVRWTTQIDHYRAVQPIKTPRHDRCQSGGSVSAFLITQCNCDCQCIQALVSSANPIISCPGPRSTRKDRMAEAARTTSLDRWLSGSRCGRDATGCPLSGGGSWLVTVDARGPAAVLLLGLQPAYHRHHAA